MFTIKFKTGDGFRTVIKEAESFTILRSNHDNGAEITLHQKNGDDSRCDILSLPPADRPEGFWPPVFQIAFIENAMGRTVEIVGTRGPEPQARRSPPDPEPVTA